MKREEVRDFLKKTSVKATGAVLAAAIAIGSIFAANYESTSVPELVTYVDTTEMVSIEEEEVPLAEPQVTTSTKTKKTTKKIKMKSASKKTYTSKGSVKTKKTTKTQKTSKKTTTTQTVTSTQVSNSYKKKSNVCTQTTTTKTTVTKTVVVKAAASTTSTTGTVTEAATTDSASTVTTNLSIAALAPKADSRVVNAWNTLGFSFKVNSSVNYSGLFDAKSRTITLKSASSSNVNYHELGHFVAFVAGNVDTTAEFKSIFEAEKANYTAYNKAYVVKNSSEYFAESYKDYVLTPDALKQSRPQTYAAIEAALANITTSQVSKIATTYAAIWN